MAVYKGRRQERSLAYGKRPKSTFRNKQEYDSSEMLHRSIHGGQVNEQSVSGHFGVGEWRPEIYSTLFW